MAYKKRASVASMFGAPSTFRPGDKEWTRLEKTYGPGSCFSPALRKAIARVVKEYIVEGAMELNAPLLTEVRRHLDEIKKAAGALEAALMASGVGEDFDESEDANLSARYLIQTGFKELPMKDRTIEELSELLTDIQAACMWGKDQVKGSDASEEGYSEGDAWIGFIRRLADVLHEAGFRATARQDSDKRVHDEAMSSFVRLVKELQIFLPSGLSKGDELNALSKRIQRALKEHRADR
jgi:hypothetical protein